MQVILFPGQGSQYKGMGKELFSKYKKETARASEILGYDIEELCVNDPERKLVKTQFTQPALYVVNAFVYYEENGNPNYLTGHSLGEYNALLAAEVFDFETGLKLVKKRGELMAAASGGGMAAVLGLNAEELQNALHKGNYNAIDIANYNTPSQTVIAGKQEDINTVVKDFGNQGITIIPLRVSAPFHSRYMQPAAKEFKTFLKEFKFSSPKVPVIANTTARPYEEGQVATMLSTQIASPVKWTDSIRYLMGKGIDDYQEMGSTILTKMVNQIRENSSPIIEEEKNIVSRKDKTIQEKKPKTIVKKKSSKTKEEESLATKLGSKAFREDYGVKYNYIAGAMYRGTASKELVIQMGKANMIGYLGTGGMSLSQVENDIGYIKEHLTNGQAYGMNLLHHLGNPDFEMKTVELFLKHHIQYVEAAAYMQMVKPLVYYRLMGLRKDNKGEIICDHKVLAKISRPEVAEAFMRPAPERIVSKLLEEDLITEEQAELSKHVPMSHDICVEADSGGHTDGGVALVLLPAIQQLRKSIQEEYNYEKTIRVGLAGGIGTPQSAACAFVMGADFVLTGSINQCTVEAGTSDTVKDLLQEINVQDTDYAPAGDMFEIGARVQVLKKGVLFPARANKLYRLYTQYEALEEIPEKTIAQLERNYFKKTIAEIWEETKTYFSRKGKESEIRRAEENPKHKMALVFRWYFGYSSRIAFDGDTDHKVNFQIHTGPALGAFNQWVKGTALEDWKNRHVDQIGIKLMEETGELLENVLASINENIE